MNNLNDLLSDNIINKSELVIKRHEYLGLDATQAAFLAKIFINNKECYREVDIETVSNLMNVDVATAQTILEPLLTKGLLGFNNKEGKSYFDFQKLIEKLLASYSAPSFSDSKEQKVKWIGKKLDFILTDDNVIHLNEIVEKTEWDILVKVIEKMANQKNQTFPLFVSLVETISNNIDAKREQIKSVLDVNWLE